MKLPAAPLAERPAADAAPGAPQTEAPPDALFAALLTLITARTAPAEGRTPQPTAAAAPLADLPAGDAPAKDAPANDAPAGDAPATAVPPAATVPVAPPPAGVAAPLSLPVAAAAQPPAKTPQRATPATPATPVMPAAKAAPATDEPAPATTAAPAAHHAHGEHPHAATPATPAAPATAAVPATPAHKAATDAPAPQAAPRATSAQPATPAAKAPKDAPAPTATAAPPKDIAPAKPHAATPAEPRPVLRAERIEALVKLATRQGGAEARMELHPQELGSVVVRLRMTSDGLQATFTATNPAAVPQLQQAGDDLRRSLEAKGLTLATLDVRAQSGDAGDGRGRQRGSTQRRGARGAVAVTAEEQPLFTSIPAGELVDVHA